MPIQPNIPLNIPPINAQIADGIWINKIMIISPNPTSPIRANITLTPWCIESGSLFPTLQQTMTIQNVLSSSVTSPLLLTAYNAICAAVQDQIISQSMFH